MQDLPRKTVWDDEKIETFRETLKSGPCKEAAERLLQKPGGVTVEGIKNLLINVNKPHSTMEPETISNCKPKKSKPKPKKKDQPWFDAECKEIKAEITECGKTLRSAPHATSVREKIYFLKKKLRNLLKKKKLSFQTSVIDDMCTDMSNKEQKKYWKQLKKLETSRDNHKYIPDYTLISHFREILHDDRIKLRNP